MFKYLNTTIFLHLLLYASRVTCSPIFNDDLGNLLNSAEDHEATSHAIIDTDDSLPTTQPGSPSDNIRDSSSTTSSTENIENGKSNHKGPETIDWKLVFVCFSMMVLLITLCKCCTHCIPNLCEMCLDKADTRRIQQRDRENTGTATAETRCKTCHARTPHPPWPSYANNCAIVAVLELEPISDSVGPVRPSDLPPQIESYPMDNEAFTNDSDTETETAMTSQRNCETPPPPYSSTINAADNEHGVDQVD